MQSLLRLGMADSEVAALPSKTIRRRVNDLHDAELSLSQSEREFIAATLEREILADFVQ